MSNDPEYDIKIETGELTVDVTVTKELEFNRIDGNGTTTAPVNQYHTVIEKDEELVRAVGNALLGWYAERQPNPFSEGKSVTQQMDEAYDR